MRAAEGPHADTGGASGATTASTHGELALPRLDLWIALALCAGLALLWTLPLSDAQAWGWDESMHAQLPAARMVVALEQGELGAFFAALHACAQYPFAWPGVLALVQLVTGISEHAGRVAGTLAWCATLFGLVCVAREVVWALRRERGVLPFDRGVPFVALALGAACPLALAFAGTFFLEVPATCAIVWALALWLVRARCRGTPRERRAELLAGACIAVAFFTKFNYGLMLALALGLDWAFEFVGALRAGSAAAFAKRSAWLAPVPAALLLWWFVLPLPLGSAVAAEHRAAFAAFLGGNQDLARYPDAWRLLFLGDWFGVSPGFVALELLLAFIALRWVSVSAVRVTLFLLLATAVPIALHPFHDARFQVVLGPGLWVLAALGWRAVRAGTWPVRVGFVAVVLAAVVPMQRQRLALARATGYLAEEDPLRAYKLEQLDAWWELLGDRRLPTAGLERAEHTQLSAFVAGEVGPEERAGWIGMSSQFSPAALHLALLAHGGSPRRFLAECERTLDVDYFGDGSGVTDDALTTYLAGFDVVFFTDPPDLKGRPGRKGFAVYRERLAGLGWNARELGKLSIARPPSAPLDVTLYACRPNR